jgi:hypothetical protein
MIEEESHEIRNLIPVAAAPLERSTMHEFTALVSQTQVLIALKTALTRLPPRVKGLTHNRLVGTEDQLLLQLSQLKDVLALSALNVDLVEETPDRLDRHG